MKPMFRSSCLVPLLASLTLGGCSKKEAPRATAPVQAQSVTGFDAGRGLGAAAAPQATTLKAPHRIWTIRMSDLLAIRKALAHRIRTSADKELRRWTAGTGLAPPSIDRGGVVRIGRWVFAPPAGDRALRFIWRRAGTAAPAFVARVGNTAGRWAVQAIGEMRIHRRRP